MMNPKELKGLWEENKRAPEMAVARFIAGQIEDVELRTKRTNNLDEAMDRLDQLLQKLNTHIPEDLAQGIFDRWNEVFCQICYSERAFYRQGLADGQALPRAMKAALKAEGLLLELPKGECL